jgi:hypothetical protein
MLCNTYRPLENSFTCLTNLTDIRYEPQRPHGTSRSDAKFLPRPTLACQQTQIVYWQLFCKHSILHIAYQNVCMASDLQTAPEGLLHMLHIFISDSGITKTLLLAAVSFGFKLLIQCLNWLLLWCILLVVFMKYLSTCVTVFIFTCCMTHNAFFCVDAFSQYVCL